MSAVPVITARLSASAREGIVLYQGLAATLRLDELIDVSLLGELLPKSPVVTTTSSGVATAWSRAIRITAASLPAGLTTPATPATAISAGSQLTGTPTTVAVTNLLLKIEVYDYVTSGAVVSNLIHGYAILPVSVVAVPTTVSPPPAIAAPDTAGAVAYIDDGSIDLFVDLQNMALSLALPKAELVLAADSTVANTSPKRLVVSPGVVLNLNVRFLKGLAVVDPEPASIRFGVGAAMGGPLLMAASEFVRVGGSGTAYFKLRATSDAAEFAALDREYYDADAVEAPAPAASAIGGGQDTGLCELEFTTGAGATLATFRSDTLPVSIRRSLLAGI